MMGIIVDGAEKSNFPSFPRRRDSRKRLNRTFSAVRGKFLDVHSKVTSIGQQKGKKERRKK